MSGKRRSKTGGRSAKRAARQQSVAATRAFIDRKIPYYELLDEASLATIEHNADTVLEEIGIEFKEFPLALSLFKEAGADIDGERVRFPRGLCRSIIQQSAPAEFSQHARNPERSVIVGGKRTIMVPAYGSPGVGDLDKGRRYATIEDFRNFHYFRFQEGLNLRGSNTEMAGFLDFCEAAGVEIRTPGRWGHP